MKFALRTHLTFIFIIIALIPVLLLGGIQIGKIGTAADERRQAQRQMTLRLADEVRTYVENHKNVIEAFAGEISSSGHRDPDGLRRVLQAAVKNFPGFVNIYAADASGKNLAFYTPQTPDEAPLAGYDFSSRNYYQEIVARKQTVISSLFQGRVTTDKPLIIIAAPLFDVSGAFDGYVSAALDLSEVAVLAEKYDYGRMAYAAVLDGTGKVVCAPENWQPGAVRDLSATRAVQAMRAAKEGAVEAFSDISQREEFVTFTTIPELEWLIFVGRSTAAYREEFFLFLRDTMTLLLLTAAGCTLLSWLIAGYLNGPMRLFMNYTREIGRQNFEISFPKALLRRMPRELTVLAKHFFAMARKLRRKQAALQKLAADLEEKVAERTDNLQAVLEGMSDAVVMVDTKKKIVFANRHMAELLQVTGAQLRAMGEDALLAALRDAARATQAVESVFAGKETTDVFEMKRDARHIAVHAFSVTSARRGVLLGHGYLFRDITERHAVEQLKNNLISLAAHEFKTPLTGIRGGVETLLRRDVVWDEAFRVELLADIHEDVLRIQRLVNDWLDISKIDAKTMVLHRDYFDLGRLIEKVQGRLLRQGLAFSLAAELDAASAAVYGDPDRIEQVLTNVLENAVFYSEAPAVIRVAMERMGGGYRIRIADRGIGIAASDVAHIFERFYRADISSTRRHGGTGLGLAVCKGIVEMHGGWIAVESEPGKGSIFTVFLPQEEAEEK